MRSSVYLTILASPRASTVSRSGQTFTNYIIYDVALVSSNRVNIIGLHQSTGAQELQALPSVLPATTCL